MPYTVKVADNYDYMETGYTSGSYPSVEEAVEACQRIVERCLEKDYEPGMSAQALYQRYRMFGDDPYIVGTPGESFSAWA